MVADDVGLGRAWETKTEGEVDHRIAHFSLRRQSIAGLLKMHSYSFLLNIQCSSMLDVSTRLEGMHEFVSNQVTTNI